MPLIDVDAVAGTFAHVCSLCQHVDTGLRLDPAAGDLRVAEQVLVLRECPSCLKRGRHVSEQFDRFSLPHHAGEEPPPGSLVGAYDPVSGGLVIEHWVGEPSNPSSREQFRLIRAMQRHPHLRAHAPLAELLHPREWPDTVREKHSAHLDEHGDLLRWTDPHTGKTAQESAAADQVAADQVAAETARTGGAA